MPVVNKTDLKRFSSNVKLPKERTSHPKIYHYRDHQTVDEAVGDGLFDGVSSLFTSGLKFVQNNKDLIANTAKSAAAVGGLAATIGSIVKANKELEQLQEIKKLRLKALDSVPKKAGISEEAKEKVSQIISDNQKVMESKGDGIMKF